MKVFSIVIKILTALAAILGAIYVIATYGDEIVAWAKNLMGTNIDPLPIQETESAEEAPAEDAPAEEAAEVPEEAEAPSEAAENDEATPVADESDFEG